MKGFVSRNVGIAALSIALIFRWFFAFNQNVFQLLYFEGIFPVVRTVQSLFYPIWLLPGYLVIGIMLLAWLLWRFPRKKKNIARFSAQVLNLLCGLIATFLFLWGMNYADKGYAARKGIGKSSTSAKIIDVYLQSISRTAAIRNTVADIENVENVTQLNIIVSDSAISSWVRKELQPLGYPVGSSVQIRRIRPKGALRKLGISGIFNPYTGEANIDDGLPNILEIFTAAHEIAHAYGVCSEAEANFVAYLACLHSGNALAVYAAEYSLWRHLGKEVNKNFEEEILTELVAAIPSALLHDREAVINIYYSHKPYFPELSEGVNDTYLKLQGIEKGTADYDDFVKLYLAYDNQI